MDEVLQEIAERRELKIQILQELGKQIQEELSELYDLNAAEERARHLDPKLKKIREEFLKEYGRLKYEKGKEQGRLEVKQGKFEPQMKKEVCQKSVLEQIMDLNNMSIPEARALLVRLKKENENIPSWIGIKM